MSAAATHSPMRTGAFSYVLIGGAGPGAARGDRRWRSTSKQISDRKIEIADTSAAGAAGSPQGRRACRRSPTSGRPSRPASDTVTSLAQSRFDWQRVLNELASVIPSNVWLTQLAGTADPSRHAAERTADPHARAASRVPPSRSSDCATGQDAVAGLVSNLEEIDGVTRVGVQSSGRATDSGSTAGRRHLRTPRRTSSTAAPGTSSPSSRSWSPSMPSRHPRPPPPRPPCRRRPRRPAAPSSRPSQPRVRRREAEMKGSDERNHLRRRGGRAGDRLLRACCSGRSATRRVS